MIYTNKEYCLEVKGSMACFTRPEMKVERVSYDIITPLLPELFSNLYFGNQPYNGILLE